MEVYICVAIVAMAVFVVYIKRNKQEEENEMPAGLQVLDAKGNVVFDSNTNLTRLVARVDLAGSGEVKLSDFGYSGSNMFFVLRTVHSPNNGMAKIYISDQKLIYQNLPGDGYGFKSTVYIGVY